MHPRIRVWDVFKKKLSRDKLYFIYLLCDVCSILASTTILFQREDLNIYVVVPKVTATVACLKYLKIKSGQFFAGVDSVTQDLNLSIKYDVMEIRDEFIDNLKWEMALTFQNFFYTDGLENQPCFLNSQGIDHYPIEKMRGSRFNLQINNAARISVLKDVFEISITVQNVLKLLTTISCRLSAKIWIYSLKPSQVNIGKRLQIRENQLKCDIYIYTKLIDVFDNTVISQLLF